MNINIKREKLNKAITHTGRTFKTALPIMFGILLLVSFVNSLVKPYYLDIFTDNFFIDPIIGAIAGSLSFGMPLIGYAIGDELIGAGVSLLAVTAFIMTWTTVGVAMLPLEAKFLGKRFAIRRNILNFIFSIIISVLVVLSLRIYEGLF